MDPYIASYYPPEPNTIGGGGNTFPLEWPLTPGFHTCTPSDFSVSGNDTSPFVQWIALPSKLNADELTTGIPTPGFIVRQVYG